MEYLTVKEIIDRGDIPNYGRPVYQKIYNSDKFEKIGVFKYEHAGTVRVYDVTNFNYNSDEVYFKTRKKSKNGNTKKD